MRKRRMFIQIDRFKRGNQGTCRVLGMYRITMTTRTVKYPIQDGCCTPVFVNREIDTVRLAGREYEVREDHPINKHGKPVPTITLSGDDRSAGKFVRKLRRWA